jgi:hypothetical protein
MKSIKITFTPQGDTRVEAFGFQGAACLAATKEIEAAIGKMAVRKDKPEMGSVVSESKVMR